MKFYFCQTCGKRLTEHDIEEGAARNKKLKGVFCRECAVGVTTMDSLPVTDEAAREILRKEEAETQPAARRERRSSAARIAAASRGNQGAGSGRIDADTDRRISSPSLTPIWIGAGAALAIGLAVALALVGRGTNTGSGNAERKPVVADDEVADRGTVNTQESSPEGRGTEASAQPVPDRKEDAGGKEPAVVDAGGQSAAKTEESAAKAAAKVEKDEADKTPGSSAPGEATVQQPSAGKTESSSKTAPADAPPTQKPPAEPPLPATPPAYQVAFHAHLDALLTALGKQDLSSFGELAARMAADTSLAEWQPAARKMSEVHATLVKRTRLRKTAIEGLVGKVIRIETTKGVQKGKVVEASASALVMRRIFKINRQIKEGPKFTVAVGDLTPAERARLFPRIEATTASEWAARVMEGLALGDLVAAEEALARCKAAASILEPPLQGRLEKQRREAREQKAEKEWISLASRGRVAGITVDRAAELLTELSAFEQANGETDLVRGRKKEIALLRERLAGVAGRWSTQKLAAQFRGRLVSHDKATGKVTLHYDFKDAVQLEDFRVTPGKKVSVRDGTVQIPGRDVSLSFDRFAGDDLDLSWDMKAVGSDRPVGIYFGTRKVCFLRMQRTVVELVRRTGLRDRTLEGEVLAKAVLAGGPWGKWSARKRGKRFIVTHDDTQVLEAEIPIQPRGERIGWDLGGNAGNPRISEIQIAGRPSRAWQEDVLDANAVLKRRTGTVVCWTNRAGDGLWSTANNWEPPRVPRAGDSVVFGGSCIADCRASRGTVAQGLASIIFERGYRGEVSFDAGFAQGDSQELVVKGDITLLEGRLALKSLVETGGQASGVGVTLKAADVFVGRPAVLHSDAGGFPAGKGPGYVAGEGWLAGRSGAHGGFGGGPKGFADTRYGFPESPISLGSGGDNTAGGGAIRIECPEGEVRVNGTIRCNGGDAAGERQYTGAGGSIFVVCRAFAGTRSGLLQANGGIPRANGVGGGGGRIAVKWKECSYKGNYEAHSPGWGGRPGTLSVPKGADVTFRRNIGLEAGSHELGRLTITDDATLYLYSDRQKGTGTFLRVDSLRVERGARVWANRGFKAWEGPGGSVKKQNESKTVSGTHGGLGGASPNPTKPYGDPRAPVSLGSGGGGQFNRGWGGGAVRIDAGRGTVSVDGLIVANGNKGVYDHGGGAGGSIFVTCGTFDGSGQLMAKGGAGGKGGGGGGRIAVLGRKNLFVGTCDVGGGPGTKGPAGKEGTVVLTPARNSTPTR